jgi:Co/Zn/Cd efflux system component
MAELQSATARNRRALFVTFILTFGYSMVEIVGGRWSNSLALLADAAHMLTDVGGLGLALFAAWIAKRPATPERTYGYYRVEILVVRDETDATAALALVPTLARRLKEQFGIDHATIQIERPDCCVKEMRL